MKIFLFFFVATLFHQTLGYRPRTQRYQPKKWEGIQGNLEREDRPWGQITSEQKWPQQLTKHKNNTFCKGIEIEN